MGLYCYKVSVSGGLEKSGKITAKTEQAARTALAKQHSIVEWHLLKEEKTPAIAPSKSKPLTKLRKLLYLQSGRCFFCGEPLAEKDANIEHLHPKSRGGTSTEDNEVICHASLNETFGDMDLKRKFEFVLKSAGTFKCPKR